MSFSLGCKMNNYVILNFAAAYPILHSMHPCNATLAEVLEIVGMSVSIVKSVMCRP